MDNLPLFYTFHNRSPPGYGRRYNATNSEHEGNNFLTGVRLG